MILRTINGGNNWLFQIPDTSITTTIYYYMNSIGKTIYGHMAYPRASTQQTAEIQNG
jgi:hypothetical protein